MYRGSKIKHFISVFLFFTTSLPFFAQKYTVDYYGINANQLDLNIAKMTSDLYYTQLSEIQNFTVHDKRDSGVISASDFSDTNLSFYALISQDELSGKWIVTYKVVNKQDNKEISDTKQFDSYYKILMESKSELQASLKKLIERTNSSQSAGSAGTINGSAAPQQNTAKASTDELSGTWEGEDSIDKIVIMRGGRGFVIFNNGASMNISVNIINGNTVKIEQKGKANASFYPELSRQVAMQQALTADPITWELSISDKNTLTGKKNTLFESGDSVEKGSVSVTWKRKL